MLLTWELAVAGCEKEEDAPVVDSEVVDDHNDEDDDAAAEDSEEDKDEWNDVDDDDDNDDAADDKDDEIEGEEEDDDDENDQHGIESDFLTEWLTCWLDLTRCKFSKRLSIVMPFLWMTRYPFSKMP